MKRHLLVTIAKNTLMSHYRSGDYNPLGPLIHIWASNRGWKVSRPPLDPLRETFMVVWCVLKCIYYVIAVKNGSKNVLRQK